MQRRDRRKLSPLCERIESRELLSGIIATMATTPTHAAHSFRSTSGSTVQSSSLGSGFVPSNSSIAVPSNQGVQGVNLAVNPTGTLSKHELRREQFAASFVGTYVVGPGRTSTEAQQIYIQAAGGSNQFLHGDIQVRLITPSDRSTQIGGVSAMFDRNINSNSTLGLDLAAPQTNVDSGGRPNSLSVSLDTNISSGAYDEGYAQGVMTIHYIPSPRHTPGTLGQGKAIVKIRAQVYSIGVDFILANSSINPGGPSQGGPSHHSV